MQSSSESGVWSNGAVGEDCLAAARHQRASLTLLESPLVPFSAVICSTSNTEHPRRCAVGFPVCQRDAFTIPFSNNTHPESEFGCF